MTALFVPDRLGVCLATIFLLLVVYSSPTNASEYKGFTWAAWSQCSATCNFGTRARYGQTVRCQAYQPCRRTFVKQRAKCYSGRSCDGPDVTWGSWGACSVGCGRGYRVRKGRVDCSYLRRQYPSARCYPSVILAKADCIGSRCTYGVTWGAWSSCSASCGGGTRVRHGSMKCTPYWYGCVNRKAKKTQACGKDQCPPEATPTAEDVTTQPPTTQEPTAFTTTAIPTTIASTTEKPTTEEPTTEEPTTEQPTTEEPTTEQPTTVQPTTEQPTTEQPTTEQPTTEQPTTVQPTTEQPTTEQPTTQQPTTQQPTTEQPTTEEPTTEQPTTEKPTTVKPTTTAVPTTVLPTTQEATTAAPTTQEATTAVPITAAPPSPTVTDECKDGHRFTDVCGQLCQCVNGEFVCYRIRKEILSMPRNERLRYVTAYKQMVVDPRTRDRYVDLIDGHRNLFFHGLHDDVYFLPWHRWYLLQIENLVREIDCRVTIPYWAWSLVSNSDWTEPLWSDDESWLGGDGVPDDYCVQTGPFREGEYELIDSSFSRCLQRTFDTSPRPNEMLVNVVLQTDAANVTDFIFGLEFTLHNRVHCQIGGTMCSIDSANAPEFFLHHGYVDKIWNDWQQKSDLHKTILFADDVLPMTSRENADIHLANGVSPAQLHDNEYLPGNVKIRYEAPNHHRAYILSAAITSGNLTATDFRSIPQVPVGKMPADAWQVFGSRMDSAALQAAKEKDAALTAVAEDANPQSLSGVDFDLGFKVADVVKMAAQKQAAK